MKTRQALRHGVIATLLIAGVCWSLASAQKQALPYPNADLLADAAWVRNYSEKKNLVIVDVREDEHFHGKLIPGAIRMPWGQFRFNRLGDHLADTFVGLERAQEILGEHGISRDDSIVLYDSVERDGGATASYVFWVLDLLGHQNKRILERGIDAWKDAGFPLVDSQETREPVLYQAPFEELNRRKLIDGDWLYQRVADPHYQILDVRSREEYVGEKGSKGLTGKPLKLGHIPTAVNINYELAWADPDTKALKPYPDLQQLYRGLSPERGVVVYCASGRRSSFSYFVLRLMGFADVYTYEPSWEEWGEPTNHYPVELTENKLSGRDLPVTGRAFAGGRESTADDQADSADRRGKDRQPKGGYVSCGG